MDIASVFTKYKPIVERALEKYLPRTVTNDYLAWLLGKPRFAYDVDAFQKAITNPIWDFLDRGGKRWRPIFMFITAKAFGADVEKLKDFSVIPEFAHNGSIIVDDIEDQGQLRRGKPCMHHLFGTDIAINAGNFLYFLPSIVLSKNKDIPEEQRLRAYELFCQEMTNIHLGQGTDIHWHKGQAETIEEKQYLQMCSYKTGCLARMAARLGVILAGGTPEQEAAMGRIGEAVGVAFQIQDDILSASATGEFAKRKGYGDDITEGKRTLIVLQTLKKAPETEKKRLLEILNKHTTDEPLITEALTILQKHGGIEYSREKAKALVDEALKEAIPLIPNKDAAEEYEAFIRYMIERKI
ncbi:MAG: polyprenyl synthetase family protein [Nanoarchaeota archaeon]|nr:polyprenyl synthetase family protein [Nanoarchaeota archaeon]